MPKSLAMLIISFILLCLPQNAMAADVLYRMLHADEVADFQEDQDALIFGQLINQKDGHFTVAVNKVLSGSVPGNEIILNGDIQYSWGRNIPAMEPQVGDYCVLSLKKDGPEYKKAWSIFKATTGDYQTLKLLSPEIRYPYYCGDIAALQWYVNSGGTNKEFFFDQNGVYVRLPGNETRLGQNNAGTVYQRPIDTESSDRTVFIGQIPIAPAIVVLLAALCGVGIIVLFRHRQ